MRVRKFVSFGLIFSGIVLLVTAYLFSRVPTASAQCGTQASSCKNCHEVQKQDPVNNDGTGWHQSHAFGDFCANCHAGNVQSMVKEEAHTGMVPPLQDVQASCGNCHPDDLGARTQVYAVALGVEPGGLGGEPAAPAGEPPAQGEPAAAVPVETKPDEAAAVEAGAPPLAVESDQNIIDYNKQYAETAGGQVPVNWGNVILGVLIVVIVAAGGAFIYWRERNSRRKAVPQTAEKSTVAAIPEVKDYPPEVLSLLPAIAKLNPAGRRALQRLLEHPEEASELLYSLSQLDPDLLRRIRNLDERARALLIALAE
jgi:hypothetical protein